MRHKANLTVVGSILCFLSGCCSCCVNASAGILWGAYALKLHSLRDNLDDLACCCICLMKRPS